MTFCIWVLWATVAWGQEDKDLELAKQAYQYGKQMYDEAEYEEAIQAFQRAYDISPKHQLLFNIAMAYRMNDELELARTYFEQYQKHCNDEEYLQAQVHIEKIEKTLDERQKEEEERILAEEALREPKPPADRLPPWVIPSVWGVSAIGVGTGLFFGIESQSKTALLEPMCSKNLCMNSASPIMDGVRQDAMIADIAYGIGLAAMSTALWLQISQSQTQLSVTSNRIILQGEF